MRVYILLSVLASLAAATEACEDIWTSTKCAKRESKGKCSKSNVIANCQATCGYCEGTTTNAPITTTVASVEGYGTSLADGSLASSVGASANSNCGDNAEGYYEEYIDGNYRYIIVSGAPSHAAEYDQDHANPNVRCELWQYIKVPVTWTDSGSDSQTMGVTGYVMSGGTVYDHRSSPFGDLASYYEWDSLDPSFGHSA